MRRMLCAAGIGLLSWVGCVTPQRAVCTLVPEKGEFTAPSPDTWSSLLVHGYDRSTSVVPRPALDCAGIPVMWQEPRVNECREPGPSTEPLPPTEKLALEDVIIEHINAHERLVWIITQRFSNGEALGPVGLIEATPGRNFQVKVLGSLRSYPEQAKLRLERSGAFQVLVAEGSICTKENPPVCQRMSRVLPIRFNRFFSEPILSKDGRCLGPGWFPLGREQVFELPNGWLRKVDLASTLKFTGGDIVVNEQVEMTDHDPKSAGVPPRLYRRAQAERMLTVQESRTVGSEASLWQRMVEMQLAAGAKPYDPKAATSVADAAQGTDTNAAAATPPPAATKPAADAGAVKPKAPAADKPAADAAKAKAAASDKQAADKQAADKQATNAAAKAKAAEINKAAAQANSARAKLRAAQSTLKSAASNTRP